jgi:hypothetical protein
MWGGGTIGVRSLDGSDGVVGFIGSFWEVQGMLSILDIEVRLTLDANHRKGDGRAFPRNPGSEEMLAKLADDLHNADKDL